MGPLLGRIENRPDPQPKGCGPDHFIGYSEKIGALLGSCLELGLFRIILTDQTLEALVEEGNHEEQYAQ